MEDKIYFSPGDVVTLRQDIENKPKMIVVKKETTFIRTKAPEDSSLKGIRCRWFTKEGSLQEAVWNTKDLIKL